MGLFIDSANIDEIAVAQKLGWVTGITTNPILLAQTKINPDETLQSLSKMDFSPIFYQLVSKNLPDMELEAAIAFDILKGKLVLKIPPILEGFQFIRRFGDRYACCLTAVFTSAQAAIAAEIGAAYIAVYVNRATMSGKDGIELVKEMSLVLAGSSVEILAASIKDTDELIQSIIAGADHITTGLNVLKPMKDCNLSSKAIHQFEREGVGLEIPKH